MTKLTKNETLLNTQKKRTTMNKLDKNRDQNSI